MQQGYWAADPFNTKAREKQSALLNRIPVVKATEAFSWPEEIKLDLRFVDVDGSTPFHDILCLLALAVTQQPQGVLEFGTFWGSTTANLARNLPNATVHTIDLPPDPAEAAVLMADRPVDDEHLIASRQLGKAFRNGPFSDRVVQHAGDTATYDYSVILDRLTFFWVDGSHTYEYAKSDTLVAFRLAQGECTIAWHDCDAIHPGVTRWLGELMDAGLAVRRIEGTVLAYLRFDAADPRIQKLIAAN